MKNNNIAAKFNNLYSGFCPVHGVEMIYVGARKFDDCCEYPTYECPCDDCNLVAVSESIGKPLVLLPEFSYALSVVQEKEDDKSV